MIQVYSADSCKGHGYTEVVEGPSLAICSPSVGHRQEVFASENLVLRQFHPRLPLLKPIIMTHDTPFLLSSKQLVLKMMRPTFKLRRITSPSKIVSRAKAPRFFVGSIRTNGDANLAIYLLSEQADGN